MVKIRTRVRKDMARNYNAGIVNGHTLRRCIDDTMPMLPPSWPEMYDIKITSRCTANCPYCYQNSYPVGNDADSEKIISTFANMSNMQLPFQIAIGGGEPTLHPELPRLLQELDNLGIFVSYTTAGYNLTPAILDATKDYAAGVALTLHEHLNWIKPLFLLRDYTKELNVHILLKDNAAIETALLVADKYSDMYNQMVLLPYTIMGRARYNSVDIQRLVLDPRLKNLPRVSYGAGFYKTLANNGFNVYKHEPEMFMRYIDFINYTVHPSSFNADEYVTLEDFLKSGVVI